MYLKFWPNVTLQEIKKKVVVLAQHTLEKTKRDEDRESTRPVLAASRSLRTDRSLLQHLER